MVDILDHALFEFDIHELNFLLFWIQSTAKSTTHDCVGIIIVPSSPTTSINA
jgi:hypothetical protein